MCESNACNCSRNEGGFIFGLLIGAVIGAFIAIYIYKNNKTQILKELKTKLEKYFKNIFENSGPTNPKKSKSKINKNPPQPVKIPVVLPNKLIASSSPSKPASQPKKMFVKAK